MNQIDDAISQLKTANVRLNDLEALLGRDTLHSSPTHMEVDFLSQCNFRCLMCHQSKMEIPPSKLHDDQIDVLIDKLPILETVLIAGLGEPLLYKNIDKFLPYLSRYHCQAHMFTNGELIDQRLDVLSHLNRISVSFDGATKKTFEGLRAGSNFKKIVSNIQKLRQRCPNTCIVFSTVISRENVDQIQGIVTYAINLGMEEVHLSPVDHTPALALRRQDYQVYMDQLGEVRRLASSHGIIIFDNLSEAHFVQDCNSQITETDQAKAAQSRAEIPEAAIQKEIVKTENKMTSRKMIHHLSAESELDELARRHHVLKQHIITLEREINSPVAEVSIPSCTAPWKYSFARSTGGARLCPYADIDIGQIENVFDGEYNTPILQEVRKSIVHHTPALSVCRNCQDDHRDFRKDSIENTKKFYFR